MIDIINGDGYLVGLCECVSLSEYLCVCDVLHTFLVKITNSPFLGAISSLGSIGYVLRGDGDAWC
jgi:hypothetical protein